MRRFFLTVLLIGVLGFIVACGGEDTDSADDFIIPEVEFIVPDTAEVGDSVELQAIVTYDDEVVTDANVVFEIWEIEDEEQENSVKFDAENNGDGTYTIEYTFEEAGTYEMYAHTDAKDMHVMPKEQIDIE